MNDAMDDAMDETFFSQLTTPEPISPTGK
jgi:hypothetical protein